MQKKIPMILITKSKNDILHNSFNFDNIFLFKIQKKFAFLTRYRNQIRT